MKENKSARLKAALLLVATMSLAIALATPSAAQAAGISYSSAKLSIWPEYDDPRVLVIMQPVLADSVQLPVKVSYLVPKGAHINMACEISAQGGHNCRPREVVSKGKYDEISYTASSRRTLFFEYYYDPKTAGTNKKFTFDFIPTARVDSVDVDIQQPLKATNFKVAPAASGTSKDDKGFTYDQYSYTNLQPNKLIPFTVSYTKTDPNPSVQKQTDSSGGNGNQSSAPGSGNQYASLLALLGAVAMIGSIIYWMVPRSRGVGKPAKARSSSRGAAATTRRPKSGKKPKKVAAAGRRPQQEKAASFCSNCGSRLDEDDSFCSSCGREVA